jgi:predicted DCC family thiol-disulfide oxidoreductase YuxK
MSDAPGEAVMLFDGVCNFCCRSVRFLLPRSSDRLRFCAMQTPRGRALLSEHGLPLERFTTLAVLEGGRLHVKSAAVLRLGEHLPPPWRALARLLRRVPPGWLDRLYEFVAANRYRIAGRRRHCAMPEPAVRHRFLA